MKCPICEIELAMTDRQGVEIDYCPKCRGVWLDRGELDKIIEKSSSPAGSNVNSESYSKDINNPSLNSSPRSSNQYEHKDHDEDDRGGYGHSRNNKKGLLGELFDF